MYSISEHFWFFIIVSTIVVIFICGRYYFAHNKSYKNEAIDYAKWENFAKVIKRAMIACENSGHSIPDDFPEVRKIVEAGVTTNPKKDYELDEDNRRLVVRRHQTVESNVGRDST